jgi:hypothetical protein
MISRESYIRLKALLTVADDAHNFETTASINLLIYAAS